MGCHVLPRCWIASNYSNRWFHGGRKWQIASQWVPVLTLFVFCVWSWHAPRDGWRRNGWITLRVIAWTALHLTLWKGFLDFWGSICELLSRACSLRKESVLFNKLKSKKGVHRCLKTLCEGQGSGIVHVTWVACWKMVVTGWCVYVAVCSAVDHKPCCFHLISSRCDKIRNSHNKKEM